uniref:Oxysterol-binding protein n=1 Tax=Saccoglossus kowalevskii TaxID=10224 RepID=A0ABM0GUL0_SACKO
LSVANAEHQLIRLSSSNPNLQVMNSDDSSKNGSSESSHKLFKSTYDKREHENKVREEFITASTEVHKNMRSLLQTIVSERSRLKQALEQDIQPTSHNVEIYQLQTQLQRAYAQNTDLKERLGRIFREADLTATPMHPIATQESTPSPALVRDVSNDSKLSVSDISEFFDAEEYFILSSSSSEAAPSDEDIDSSFLSDEEFSEETGDLQSMCPSSVVENDIQPSYSKTGRRSKLPVPKADVGDFSMWNLLKKNIGKDLSKVSMPVTLNEPIGVLQRLCEELEYSELLDKASQTDDIYRRMVLVAAFAVSGYASSQHRAGQKPFNPMLGETYECIRDDKGFKFVSEQVSHHPPISACHCESDSFTFWQDIRIKTKFWGKSMEFLPIGTVNVIIPRYNDHYRWNKVTTCVHNILSGQRWVDQFGEMIIHNGPITCKLTFAKASYWSSKRYEVYGGVYNADGKVVHQLFGKWTEGMYCGISGSAKCIWRPGAMPEDYDLYYGFSKFAVELNDLDPNQKLVLPPTDSRFRPDQRMLEEGNIDDAEKEKLRIENSQRERKKQRDEKKLSYEPLFFKKSLDGDKECWVTNGHYWKLRENPGFAKMKEKFVKLW